MPLCVECCRMMGGGRDNDDPEVRTPSALPLVVASVPACIRHAGSLSVCLSPVSISAFCRWSSQRGQGQGQPRSNNFGGGQLGGRSNIAGFNVSHASVLLV